MSGPKSPWRGWWHGANQASSDSNGKAGHGNGAPQPGKIAEPTAPFLTPDRLQNILGGSGLPLVVVDHELKLRFFTPAATALFKISDAALGKPLAEIARRFVDDDLILDAQTVIAANVALRRSITTDGGSWFSRRLMPYRAADDEQSGIVITFVDISDIRQAEREADTARAYSNSVIDAIRQSLVVLDDDLRILSATPSFYRGFAIMPGDAVGKLLPSLRDRCFDVPAMNGFLEQIAAGDNVPENYGIEIELSPRGRRALLLKARNISLLPPSRPKTLLAIDDVTDGIRHYS